MESPLNRATTNRAAPTIWAMFPYQMGIVSHHTSDVSWISQHLPAPSQKGDLSEDRKRPHLRDKYR